MNWNALSIVRWIADQLLWCTWPCILLMKQRLLEQLVSELSRILLTCPGRITKTLFFGDQKITDSEKYLVTAIEKYRAALDTIILSICLRVHDVLNGIVV